MRFARFLAVTALATSSWAAAQATPTDTENQFNGGFPTKQAAERARDEVDFQRAVTAYRFWYPTVSAEGVFAGNREQGIRDNETIPILSAGPRQVVFTANSDTPYGGGCLDVKDGPMVVELPPGPFIAVADDHHQGWIMDMGLPGPDAGKGGKHLIVGPEYKGEPPAGFHVGRSNSNKVFLAIRSMPANGDMKGALEALRSIKVYPLATASNPKLLQYVDVTDRKADMTCLRWEDNIQYWEHLHQVIDAEPLVEEFRRCTACWPRSASRRVSRSRQTRA